MGYLDGEALCHCTDAGAGGRSKVHNYGKSTCVSVFMKTSFAPPKSFFLLRDVLCKLQQPAIQLRIFPYAFRNVADKAEDGIFIYFLLPLHRELPRFLSYSCCFFLTRLNRHHCHGLEECAEEHPGQGLEDFIIYRSQEN